MQEYRTDEAEFRLRVRSAFHEAGHAVAAELLLRGVEFVTIQEEIKIVGDTKYIYSGFSQPRNHERPLLTSLQALHTELVVAFAGPVAEYAVMTVNEQVNESKMYGQDDLQIAVGLCNSLKLTDTERTEALHKAMASSGDFVNNNSVAIEAVANALLRCVRLSGEEVSEIVRRCAKESIE